MEQKTCEQCGFVFPPSSVSCPRCGPGANSGAELELDWGDRKRTAVPSQDEPPAPPPRSDGSHCPRCAKAVTKRRCDHCGAAVLAGDYAVVRLISEANQTRTYLAQAPSGTMVFLKELLFILVPDAQALDAFRREGELLKQLRHLNIPKYLAHFSEGEGPELRLYLAEEYVEGRSLLQELETRRFSEEEARKLALELLAILTHLHERQPPILHRDLKPANVICRPDGQLSLVDFGSARDGALRPAHGVTMTGTLGYAPPEQLAGAATPGSDVYGLAATLVHVLTRQPPWEYVTTGFELALRELKLSRDFTAWLRRALAVNPARRFATAKEATDALSGKSSRSRLMVPLTATVAALALGGALVAGGALEKLQALTTHAQFHPTDVEEMCPPGAFLDGDSRVELSCVTPVGGKRVRNGVSAKYELLGGERRLIQLAHFRDDVLDGDFVRFTLLGERKEAGLYFAGQRQGKWLVDDAEGFLVNGKKEGVWTSFFANGTARETTTWLHDVRHGPHAYFNMDGSKQNVSHFKMGTRDGQHLVYYHSGQLESQTAWVNGRMEGPHKVFFSTGTPAKTGTYTGDLETGDWSEYFPSGKLKLLTRHNGDGTGNGSVSELTYFTETGLKLDEWKGRTSTSAASRVWYDETGAKKSEDVDCEDAAVTDRSMRCRLDYYADGKLKLRCGIGGDSWSPQYGAMLGGACTGWHPDGSLRAQGEYAAGGRTGTWRYFWPNQKLMRLDEWEGGVQQGKQVEYFESGRLRLSGTWKRGNKKGVWIEKAADGRLISNKDYE